MHQKGTEEDAPRNFSYALIAPPPLPFSTSLLSPFLSRSLPSFQLSIHTQVSSNTIQLVIQVYMVMLCDWQSPVEDFYTITHTSLDAGTNPL